MSVDTIASLGHPPFSSSRQPSGADACGWKTSTPSSDHWSRLVGPAFKLLLPGLALALILDQRARPVVALRCLKVFSHMHPASMLAYDNWSWKGDLPQA